MSSRIVAIGLALMGPVVMAAGEGGGKFAAPAEAVAPTQVDGGAGILQIFGSLAVVIATILLVGWIARRLRQTPRDRNSALRVVDEIAVGSKERVVLVEVDGARLVLGVGDGRVAILHRTAAMPTSATAPTTGASGSGSSLALGGVNGERFVDLLRRSLGK